MSVVSLRPSGRRRFTSGYADRVHSPRVVSRVLRTMIEQYPAFADARPNAPEIDFSTVDTLVGTGLSGALIVPALTRSLQRAGYDVDYLLVRKDNDGTHSVYQVEGNLGRRWMFVDDLVASGRTLRRCIRKIRKVAPDAELAAVFLYGDGSASAGNGDASLTATYDYRDGDNWTFDQWDEDEDNQEYRTLGEFHAFELARPRVREVA